MMFFSERKKLAEEYEKWISENKEILDCPLTIISWLVGEGWVSNKKASELKSQLALTEKALELAVADKCKFENALLSTSLGFINGKVAVPKKEQWYLERAKEMKSE